MGALAATLALMAAVTEHRDFFSTGPAFSHEGVALGNDASDPYSIVGEVRH